MQSVHKPSPSTGGQSWGTGWGLIGVRQVEKLRIKLFVQPAKKGDASEASSAILPLV